MTQVRKHFTPAQKREYAKLMVAEGYSNKSVQELSGACQSAISRWKRQYLSELSGVTPAGQTALTPEHQRIQTLERENRQLKKDNSILKKAAAFFIQDNPSLR
jgi:transposase